MAGQAFVGRVVSNRMQKTVVVAVDYVVWRPKHKVYEKRTSKHFAHDAQQACNIGDTVRIKWTRRLSKHKTYKVDRILRRVDVYSQEFGAQQVAAAESREQRSRVELAEAAYAQAQQRLAKLQQLREAYDQDMAATGLAGSSSSNSSNSSSSSNNSSSSSSSNPQQG